MTIKKEPKKKPVSEVSSPVSSAPLDAINKFSGKYFEAIGRRKSATARVRLYPDKKKRILINDQDYNKYLALGNLIKLVISPLKATGKEDCSLTAQVSGGGRGGQATAVALGIARSLIKMDHDLKPTLKALGLLTRDPREKERKKPGLKRARRAPQWSKR
jgi:small subunit ribosomal protein S9